MCGIAGFYFKNPEKFTLNPQEIEDFIDMLLLGIEHRGTHATGIAAQDVEGESLLEKSDMTASKFVFWRREVMPNPRAVILHTRMYTKGKPENLLNNHPVQYSNIMAVHNGHISNDDELFKDEEIERFAEVDSEIIPALLHKYSMIEPKEALEKMKGGFAIAALDANNPGKLLLAKSASSPLVFLETNDMWIWASEEKPIKDAMSVVLDWDVKTGDVKWMKYGEYILIDGGNYRRADFETYVKPYTPPTSGYSYGHNPSQLNGFDQCDECFSYVSKYNLNRIGINYYCNSCEKKMFDVDENGMRIPKVTKKLSKKERKRLRKEARRRFQESQKQESKKLNPPTQIVDATDMQISDILDEEHKLVCGMVADYYGTRADFVDMILFDDSMVAEDDPNLATMYLEFSDKYEEFLESVRGTTDIMLDKVSKKRNPIGFGGF